MGCRTRTSRRRIRPPQGGRSNLPRDARAGSRSGTSCFPTCRAARLRIGPRSMRWKRMRQTSWWTDSSPLKAVEIGRPHIRSSAAFPRSTLRSFQADCRTPDTLADTVDAVADALTAESVYQLVQGKPERAAARPRCPVASGDTAPPELEVVRTPRPGTAVTHRVLALFQPRSVGRTGLAGPRWKRPRECRARFAPCGPPACWVTPARMQYKANYLDPGSRAVLSTQELRLSASYHWPPWTCLRSLRSAMPSVYPQPGRLLAYHVSTKRPADLPRRRAAPRAVLRSAGGLAPEQA